MDLSQLKFTRRSALASGAALAAGAAIPPGLAHAVQPHARIGRRERALLARWARDTWRSLVAMTDPDTGLVSDNITGDLAAGGRAAYTSPTNLGGYLWSALVARELGIISKREASARIARSLDTLAGLEHHTPSGMYFNWYNPADGSVITTWPENGNPVDPFVSSVDAAWLGAGLLCVRNGDKANSDQAGEMFDKMRFDVFADPTFVKPYLNYGGFYVEQPARSDVVLRDLIGADPVWYTATHHYDTIVSETRITTYLGIAKRQVPGSAYYQAWRTFPDVNYDWQEMPPQGTWRTYLGVDVFEGVYNYGGLQVVPGWGGSMFEELMPNVFVPEESWAPRSWGRNHRRHVDAQIYHGLRDATYGYWGFSPASNPAGGYREYGVDALGLNPDGYFSDQQNTNFVWNNPPTRYGDGVVTPHALFLGMMHRRGQATANLTKLARSFDAYGRGGFYDAVAVRSGTVARRYLSLDQAMVMGALGNVIGDAVLQRYFCAGEVSRRVRPVIAPEEFGP